MNTEKFGMAQFHPDELRTVGFQQSKWRLAPLDRDARARVGVDLLDRGLAGGDIRLLHAIGIYRL